MELAQHIEEFLSGLKSTDWLWVLAIPTIVFGGKFAKNLVKSPKPPFYNPEIAHLDPNIQQTIERAKTLLEEIRSKQK